MSFGKKKAFEIQFGKRFHSLMKLVLHCFFYYYFFMKEAQAPAVMRHFVFFLRKKKKKRIVTGPCVQVSPIIIFFLKFQKIKFILTLVYVNFFFFLSFRMYVVGNFIFKNSIVNALNTLLLPLKLQNFQPSFLDRLWVRFIL